MWYNPPDAMERDRFHAGYSERAYQYLGAHPVYQENGIHWHFAVWAPNAKKVCLTGEFSNWEAERYPMEKQYDGIWELRLPATLFSAESDPEKYSYPGADEKLKSYKYAILGADDVWHYRGDPYGFSTECRPNNASRLWDMSTYEWQDGISYRCYCIERECRSHVVHNGCLQTVVYLVDTGHCEVCELRLKVVIECALLNLVEESCVVAGYFCSYRAYIQSI